MAKQGQEGGSSPKKPYMVLYLLVKGGDRTFWMKYGAAWLNSDGSINIKMDLLPDAQFQLRSPKDDSE